MRVPHRPYLLGALVGLIAIAAARTFGFWTDTRPSQSQVRLNNPAQIAIGRTIYGSLQDHALGATKQLVVGSARA